MIQKAGKCLIKPVSVGLAGHVTYVTRRDTLPNSVVNKTFAEASSMKSLGRSRGLLVKGQGRRPAWVSANGNLSGKLPNAQTNDAVPEEMAGTSSRVKDWSGGHGCG